MEFVNLGAQHALIHAKIEENIKRVLVHKKFILGPEVAELEVKLAQFTGSRYCISVANGTDALQVALMAIGVGPGDEVIVPGYSYIASAEAAALLGATPIFADVSAHTYNLDPQCIESLITKRTKAIIAVSLFGRCADFDALNDIANAHGLVLIEDGAQSFGAQYKGKMSCNLSALACTSFFPSKPLGCYGDGGAIFTNNKTYAELARKIARHGQDKKYYHSIVGVNSRLDSIQAAILLAKLDIFKDEIHSRSYVASSYNELLKSTGDLVLPQSDEMYRSVWAQYTIQTSHRDDLQSYLTEKGIPTNIYYPVPLHRQEAFAQKNVTLPVSECLAARALSLPICAYTRQEDVVKISEIIKDYFSRF